MNSTASTVDSPLPPSVEPVERAEPLVPNRIPEAQWDLIQLCVHSVRMLGVPRSVGEIFGFVFSSPRPVNFDEIVSSLGISNGSASHGLRYLRRVGAVCVTYLARDRRDHYIAETSLGRFFSGYLMENISHHLGGNVERLAAMRSRLAATAESGGHLPERVDLLLEWNRQASTMITAAAKTLSAATE
jgi:DNA-binding transcriptional regulator GbsR (MarR family)